MDFILVNFSYYLVTIIKAISKIVRINTLFHNLLRALKAFEAWVHSAS